mgnify:CR=1 FL=1
MHAEQQDSKSIEYKQKSQKLTSIAKEHSSLEKIVNVEIGTGEPILYSFNSGESFKKEAL